MVSSPRRKIGLSLRSELLLSPFMLFSPHFAEGEREASARAGFVPLNLLFTLNYHCTAQDVEATRSQKTAAAGFTITRGHVESLSRLFRGCFQFFAAIHSSHCTVASCAVATASHHDMMSLVFLASIRPSLGSGLRNQKCMHLFFQRKNGFEMQVRRACRLASWLGIPPFHPLCNVNGEEIKAHTWIAL